MTRTANFEVPTLADAINKAARIAPTKGSEADKAAGVMIDVDPARSGEEVIIRATDLNVSVRLVVNHLSLGDEACLWRVPSRLMNGILSTLPMGTGNTIELMQKPDGADLLFKSDKTKAKLRLITGDYPLVAPIDQANLTTVDKLAKRINQVAWAADRNAQNALQGIHIDGQYVVACDTARLAVAPCAVPVKEPVTAQLAPLASLLRNTGEVRLGATENRLELMPDDYTQATCKLIQLPFPNYKNVIKDNTDQSLTFNTEHVVSTLDRTLVLVKEERDPATNLEIGDGYMKIEFNSPEVGRVVDEVEVDGQHVGDPVRMRFHAQWLREAILNSGRGKLTMKYGPNAMSPIHLGDISEFLVVMMPMRVV